jgi:hypothetical protein
MIDSLKYVMNPSSQLVVQEMKVAFIPSYRSSMLNYSVTRFLSATRPDLAGSLLPGSIQEMPNNNRDLDFERSRFVDVGYSKYSSIWSKMPENTGVVPTQHVDVKMKVMLNLRRTDAFADSNTQNVLLVLTYPVDVVNPTAGFDWSSPDDALPTARIINNTSFLAGSYTFSAADSIVIGPNVDLSPSAVLNMYAPLVVIKSAPGGDPQIRIQANDPRVVRRPLHPDRIVTGPATSFQISAACSSSLYIASTIKKRPDEDDKPTTTLEQRDEEVSPLILSPNPASDRVAISFHQEQIGAATVTVRDILGQPLLQQVYQGLLPNCEQRVELNTSTLATGLYIVTVAVDGRQLQSRLSIQR